LTRKRGVYYGGFPNQFRSEKAQYLRDKQEAEDILGQIATRSQYNAIKALGTQGTTAVSRITDDVRHMVQIIAGADVAEVDLVGAREFIDNRLMPIWEKLGQALSEPTLAEPENGLIKIVDALIDERDYWAQQSEQANKTNEQQLQSYENTTANLTEQIKQLQGQLQIASKAAQTNEQKYIALRDQQRTKYEQIINSMQDNISGAQDRETQARNESKQLNEDVTKYRVIVKQLNERLQQFQPDPETESAALEPDGHVVSVVPRDKLAYINLASDDHIYRGLTFTVYDRYQPIPKSGQGKGSLEVIEIMDAISKCRITDDDDTNPITEKDIIANLVWNKDKKYLFCVAGDFDFNGDGQVDPDGTARVIKLIEQWGGRAEPTLSVDTDFFVVGYMPAEPAAPRDEYLETEAEAFQAYQRARQRRQLYGGIRQKAAELGVPTFNLSRFLYFIGYYQQAQAVR